MELPKSFRLTRLEVREVRMPFRFRFKHALAERREAHNLILAVHSSTGHLGYGEVVPRSYLTGETVASAWDDLQQTWWPAVRERRFPLNRPPLDVLREVYLEADRLRRTAAYGGLDVAIVDLWGRVTHTPGSRLFGQIPQVQRLTWPIGGGGPSAVRWMARLGRHCGFRDHKIKVGMGDDEQRLAGVRRVLGGRRDLRVDANAAWSVDQALSRVSMLQRYGVSSVEQPTAADDLDGLARIQRDGGVDVMADESLCTRGDAAALIAARAANLWNLRLGKVGGFSGFLELLDLARSAGVAVHHGVLVGESPVLTAAGRACSGLARFVHVEYGFPHLLLRAVPFRGCPGGALGIAAPLRSEAGLGVEPNGLLLERFTVRKADCC